MKKQKINTIILIRYPIVKEKNTGGLAVNLGDGPD